MSFHQVFIVALIPIAVALRMVKRISGDKNEKRNNWRWKNDEKQDIKLDQNFCGSYKCSVFKKKGF